MFGLQTFKHIVSNVISRYCADSSRNMVNGYVAIEQLTKALFVRY